MEEKIAVVGLGYVGLPVAVALAERLRPEGARVIGFDIAAARIAQLRAGEDATREIDSARLTSCGLEVSDDPGVLEGAGVIIVTVPTPITDERRPDLTPLERACATIGPRLSRGALVVFESTVFPGVTEDICGPWLAQHSGLVQGEDFALGYSPEQINPGDHVHRLETITKIIAADSPSALERMHRVYGAIVDAGLHEAPSIKVAEAAKVIENTQRDLNIALMNEIALIFDRMGLATRDVLAAAGTKWNFLPFTPGLVGGHCIGVDPFYLTAAAERLGYRPEVILAGRRINDSMGQAIAQKVVKLLIANGVSPCRARVGVMGLTFKQDVPDIRNSKVPDILAELREYRIEALVSDPLADPAAAAHEYGITLSPPEDLVQLDALVLAVNHAVYLADPADLVARVREGGVLVDVKSALDRAILPGELVYWSL
ncbi:nucleotide sugar dehydrogenase [Porphyrobacter sp. CACIAM 03H1]|uniref:nucleotide sugar dehydrogenase n=1 Tax=Porphyrobacter sp. CACIAM 03H1 TaxID=2003315 RepID=UPI000B5A5744|nr:nucleotide sugar dehydrogenase [Porphyrobacter sp. CACIAM 03H1]ASJ89791.1 UDP-N-acetyl-D-galactosamine dehydrogenase [Porphyrobacter sp. CACIAM 03H1]